MEITYPPLNMSSVGNCWEDPRITHQKRRLWNFSSAAPAVCFIPAQTSPAAQIPVVANGINSPAARDQLGGRWGSHSRCRRPPRSEVVLITASFPHAPSPNSSGSDQELTVDVELLRAQGSSRELFDYSRVECANCWPRGKPPGVRTTLSGEDMEGGTPM